MSGKGKHTVRKSGGKPAANKLTTGPKVRDTGKPNANIVPAIATSSTASMPSGSAVEPSETKELALSFPLIKISDNARELPRYTAILTRTEDEGVCMEDLDTVQLELEALLSAAAMRIRALKGEVGALNQAEEKRDKKAKAIMKPMSPGKRSGAKLQDERQVKKAKETPSRPADAQQPTLQLKITKVKSLPSTAAFQPSTSGIPEIDILDSTHTETLAPVASKNDIPNKFWATVEPYCAEISSADVRVVKDLIQAHENQVANLTIPPLGKHYTLTWLQEDVNEEAIASAALEKKKKLMANLNQPDSPETSALLKKLEKRSEPAAAGAFTQRVVSALLEENLMPSKESVDERDCKDGETDGPRTRLSNGLSLSNSSNMEIHIRKELQEQGLLDPDEVPKEEDDEILTELKKCQEELKRLSQHNVESLTLLLNMANEEMGRQDLRRKLNVIDMQVVDAYKKVLVAKSRKKPLTKKEKEPTWRLLKERDLIVRQLEAPRAFNLK